MSESKVDFDELGKLTEEVRRAKTSLDAGVQGFGNSPSPQPTAPTRPRVMNGYVLPSYNIPGPTPFGNTSAGESCLGQHAYARSAMDSTLKTFANTIESDYERLRTAMALYRKVDAEQADNMLAINRNQLDVLTTHLTTPEGQENNQAAQIKQLRDLVGGPANGSTVVTGDFNAGSAGNSASAGQIRDFNGQGFDVNGGQINDGRGGTSLTNKPIDHLMPRGVGSSPATRWDRHPSDHDGQAVDLTMPNW
jgi:hypothetical protein